MPPVRFDLNSDLGRAAEAATSALRAYADQQGWPGEIVSGISLTAEKGLIKADIPEHLRQDVEDLEYGSADSAPNSAIGNFFHSHDGGRHLRDQALRNMDSIVAEIGRAFS